MKTEQNPKQNKDAYWIIMWPTGRGYSPLFPSLAHTKSEAVAKFSAHNPDPGWETTCKAVHFRFAPVEEKP